MSDVRKDFVSAPEQESPVNKESQWGSHQPLLGAPRAAQRLYLLELWEDFRYLAEIIFRERMASTAASSTSALFLIRPTRKNKETRYTCKHNRNSFSQRETLKSRDLQALQVTRLGAECAPTISRVALR